MVLKGPTLQNTTIDALFQIREKYRKEYYHKPVHATTIRIHLRAQNSSA
jgi:hypothetical protein